MHLYGTFLAVCHHMEKKGRGSVLNMCQCIIFVSEFTPFSLYSLAMLFQDVLYSAVATVMNNSENYKTEVWPCLDLICWEFVS